MQTKKFPLVNFLFLLKVKKANNLFDYLYNYCYYSNLIFSSIKSNLSGTLKVSDLFKFDGIYYIWKHLLLLFLTTKKQNDIVKGTKVRPSIPTLVSSQALVRIPITFIGSKQEWDTFNTNALSIIIVSLENSQQCYIQSATLALKLGMNCQDFINQIIM